MIDQLIDRILYGLMAAVLVIPEPTTFLVGLLLLAGTLAHVGGRLWASLRYNTPDEPAEVAAVDEPALA